ALVMCIRLPNLLTRKRPGVFTLETAIVYLGHAGLLLASLVLVFDPPFSPEQVSQSLGLPVSLLGLYYVAALSIGYYSGFFLVIFRGTARYSRVIYGSLRWVTPKAMYALLAVAGLGLLARNIPAIRLVNGPSVARFSRYIMESLPSA